MKHLNPNKQMLRLAAFGLAISVTSLCSGQSANTVIQPVRFVVPVNTTNTVSGSFTTTVGGTVTDPLGVQLSISGLPAEAAYSFSTNNFTNTVSGTLFITNTGILAGSYPIVQKAEGHATNNLALTVESAHIWTGATFTNGGSADISLAGNWLNGNIPSSTSDVVLYNSSGQADGVATTNILVSSNTEIGSLRSAITAAANRRHNIQINNGVTLKISGQNGLKAVRDRSDTTEAFQLAFTGQQGTLHVTNPSATILTINQANQNGRLIMTNLGTFIADVYSVGLADQISFPNWLSLSTNGYTGNALPQQGSGGYNLLARTNIITCSAPVDPNNWNDPAIRQYSMVIGRNHAGGSTQRFPTYLGFSNVFFMNSFCYAAGASPGMDSGGNMIFAPTVTTSGNSPIAIFRGPGGMNDRMAMFAMSDGAGIGASSSAAKSVVNFSNGRVDMLVDRIYLSRERTNSSGSTPSASPSATLTMAAGTIDANYVILGYQGQGNNLGVAGFCQGTLNVNAGGTFRVNNTMELGHTTADAGHTTDAEQTYGRFTVSGAGAILMASNITVGGVTKLSGSRNSGVYNTVTVSSGGKLVVTNGLGNIDKTITTLTVGTGTLTLHVDGTRATPYIYTTNLTATGSNTIQLATVTGLTTDPQTVKLISYETFGGSFNLMLPAGLYGYLENDTVNKTINAVLTTVPPKLLVWNGTPTADWDNATANWQGGLLFVSGDFARFDDSAAGSRALNVVGTQNVGSGGVTVSNAGPAYSFAGGTIAGTSTMTKSGSGDLTVDCNSQLQVSLQQGSMVVTANGSIGSATVAAGTSLTSTGSVNGITASGTVNNYGNIPANGAVISGGGAFTNNGTVTGAFGVSGTGSIAVNNGTITASGTSTIAATNTLINNGLIVNSTARTTINGVLYGNGTFRDNDGYNNGVDGRLQIAGGATCSPGNGPGSIGLLIVEGRFDTSQNANLLIEVAMDGSSTNHDIVAPDYWGEIRCNIVMTNIGLFPFAAGQSFQIVSNHLGGLNNLNINPNRNFQFVPPSPGLGLLWDGTDVFTNGIARIKAIPSTPTSLTTTMVANTNQMTLSWPAGYIGWELQQQIRQLTNGISVLAADWTKVANSDTNNQVTVTINTNNQAVFYRLAHPTFY